MIEVEHAGIHLGSPLILYGGQDSPQAVALLSLAAGRASGDGATGPGGPAIGTPWGLPVAPAPTADTAPAARADLPGPMRAMSILGLVVAAVMAVAGILVVIPAFGLFGIVWTGMALLILVINGSRFLRRGW